PERKPDRLRDAGLVDELHHDAFLVPHPLYQRRDIAALRLDDDDPGRRLGHRSHRERQVRDALEQTAAQRANSLGYPRAQQTMDDERLAQSHESGDVHGPGLESRGVRVVVEASGRKLESRAPSETRRSEQREIANPESAGRERSV